MDPGQTNREARRTGRFKSLGRESWKRKPTAYGERILRATRATRRLVGRLAYLRCWRLAVIQKGTQFFGQPEAPQGDSRNNFGCDPRTRSRQVLVALKFAGTKGQWETSTPYRVLLNYMGGGIEERPRFSAGTRPSPRGSTCYSAQCTRPPNETRASRASERSQPLLCKSAPLVRGSGT